MVRINQIPIIDWNLGASEANKCISNKSKISVYSHIETSE